MNETVCENDERIGSTGEGSETKKSDRL